MGFLQDFGLDEIVSSVSDMANELSGLKDDLFGGIQDDIVAPFTDQVDGVQSAIQDITNGVIGNGDDAA
jgi:hypothetical protein